MSRIRQKIAKCEELKTLKPARCGYKPKTSAWNGSFLVQECQVGLIHFEVPVLQFRIFSRFLRGSDTYMTRNIPCVVHLKHFGKLGRN